MMVRGGTGLAVISNSPPLMVASAAFNIMAVPTSAMVRTCLSDCRVQHLTRTIPPRQIHSFMVDFDTMLRTTLVNLLEVEEIDELWWAVAKLPPKFAGIGLRTGLELLGANYATSVIKS